MADYAILRLEKRSLAEATAMAKHALRTVDVPHADANVKSENIVFVGSTVGACQAEFHATNALKKRKDAVQCLEFFVGASPEIMAKMTRQKQVEYLKRSLDFVGDEFGGRANVVLAVAHFDEATPHLQVLLKPILDGKLQASKMVGNRHKMVELQTKFAEVCGKPFGMRRGEFNSPATHTSVQSFHKAVALAGKTNSLPERIEPPRPLPEPEKPGMFAGAEKRAAYDAAVKKRAEVEAERVKAIAHNRRIERQIRELAKVGLVAKGAVARSAGQRSAKAEAKELSAEAKLKAAESAAKEGNQIITEAKEAQELAKAVTAEAKKALAALPQPVAVEATENARQKRAWAIKAAQERKAQGLDGPKGPKGP